MRKYPPATFRVIEHLRRATELAAVACAVPHEHLKLIVAVSGGEDSMALLHLLAGENSNPKQHLIVAHYDHALRAESANDERFVRDAAHRYGCQFVSERAVDRPDREGIEAWARARRYEFFERCRIAAGAHLIVTAHHRRDQAETLLMRLVSGRLATYAHAISPLDMQRRLFRPMLRVEKDELRAALAECHVEFVVDETNTDVQRTRNLIRHRVMPFLASELNPDVEDSLACEADRFRDDEDFMDAVVSELALAHPLAVRSGDSQLQELRVLPQAVLWRMLRRAGYAALGEPAFAVGYDAWTRLARLVIEPPFEEKICQLGGGNVARVSERNGIRFAHEDSREH
ncbi:MAG: tRNA lysidine(34) synthetase TilS [Deltaproteobacteria bacterium]|nr:tRNA lysidine(34) synthetase TilS [Deltaproteobacteria bacterium]